MRYAVAVKQVPDSDSAANPDGSPARNGRNSILDPYCELALRRTISLKDEGDTVEVFTMGPPQAEKALRRCLSLGADHAYLLTDPDFAGSDTWATSRVLASFLMRHCADADLVVFGMETLDGGTGQVPAEVAKMLDVPQFYYVRTLEKGSPFIAVQDYGEFTRRIVVPRGSVVSFCDVDPDGALPTIEGFVSSRGKEVIRLDRVSLGLGLYSVGPRGSPTRVVRSEALSSERRNTMVEISNPDTAADLIIKEWRSST